MTSKTKHGLGSRTPVTPGAIFNAMVQESPEYPGILFVYPWSATASGRSRSRSLGWPAPIVIVDGEVDDDLVVRAAELAGRMTGHKRSMRLAALAWLHSLDRRRCPNHVPDEARHGWPDEGDEGRD